MGARVDMDAAPVETTARLQKLREVMKEHNVQA
jgi:hypothetical protein